MLIGYRSIAFTHSHPRHPFEAQKAPSLRFAQASGRVYLGPKAYELVAANRAAKGDVLAVSQVAGIMAAKQTSMLIPLCHGIPLNKVGGTQKAYGLLILVMMVVNLFCQHIK